MVLQRTCSFLIIFLGGGGFVIFEMGDLIFTSLDSIIKPYL